MSYSSETQQSGLGLLTVVGGGVLHQRLKKNAAEERARMLQEQLRQQQRRSQGAQTTDVTVPTRSSSGESTNPIAATFGSSGMPYAILGTGLLLGGLLFYHNIQD